jgi:hypothetical protein
VNDVNGTEKLAQADLAHSAGRLAEILETSMKVQDEIWDLIDPRKGKPDAYQTLAGRDPAIIASWYQLAVGFQSVVGSMLEALAEVGRSEDGPGAADEDRSVEALVGMLERLWIDQSPEDVSAWPAARFDQVWAWAVSEIMSGEYGPNVIPKPERPGFLDEADAPKEGGTS